MIIYSVRNKLNGKKYVGYKTDFNSTEDLLTSEYYGSGSIIKKAIKKYGKENFERKVLLKNIFDFDELCRYEVLWIKKLNTKKPNGYNLADGGKGNKGWVISDEIRNKMSISAKNKPPMKNETKEKISKKLKGKIVSKQTKIKISKANRKENHPMWGRKISEEHKNKIIEKLTGRPVSKETRQKISKSLQNHVVAEETKNKISKTLMGRPCPEENKIKISKMLKGRPKSEETKKKISEARKKKYDHKN